MNDPHVPDSDLTPACPPGPDPPAYVPTTRASWSDAPIPPYVSSPEPADLPEIPGYEVLGEIARGGMGRVLAAHEQALGRDVAIKILLPGLPPSQAAARFVREAGITARLPHPNIPPVHALGTLADGSPFLAMKRIEGDTLAELLKERTDPAEHLPRFVDVFEQVCQAVGFAHSRGVVHRDLKPQNVMVGAFGEVQVMDWGLAREVRSAECEARSEKDDNVDWSSAPRSALRASHSEDETRAGEVIGTPAYMPPEQARGENERVGPWSDAFALGGILAVILTGKPPYTGSSSRAVWIRAAESDLGEGFARLDACGADPELVGLAKQCLAKDPADRPADAKAVAAAVAAYRGGVAERLREAQAEAVAADARAEEEANTRREAEAKVAEQRKKRRFQLALAAALGLLVAGGVGFAWWRDEQATEREVERERADAKLARSETDRVRESGERKTTETRAEAGRQARERETRERVPALLGLATDLRKLYRFREAGEAIDQAAALAGGGLTPELVPAVGRARGDLAFVVELDEIRVRESIWVPAPATQKKADARSPWRKYRAAFAARGFDLASADPGQLAERVRASWAWEELVAALDDWAVIEPDAGLRDRILAVARRADPGPWTDRFRDAAAWDDRERFEALIAEAQTRPAAVSPAAITALVLVMTDTQRYLDQDPSRLLAAAQAAHPNDFLITFVLGQWYFERSTFLVNSPDKQAEYGRIAVGYYVTAHGLRPDNLVVLINLGVALSETGNPEGAAYCFREAIRLDVARKYATPHFNLGVLLVRRKNLGGAIDHLRTALEIDPTQEDVRQFLDAVTRLKASRDAGLTRLGLAPP
jgi:tRNA A-37 threonylcarbamoyl transferase component Bud32/tetratricopeptide (TPR) repeat protein